MRTDRILHPQLARAVAELGHTDIVMVVDPGFPIPRSVERIDLGLWPGLPTVVQVGFVIAPGQDCETSVASEHSRALPKRTDGSRTRDRCRWLPMRSE